MILLTLFLCGCAQPASIGKPEIREISHRWGEVTHSTTEIVTEVKVFNPNPISLPLKDVLTEVYINNLKIGQGSALKAEIKASSESDIVISTKLENGKIPEWWVSHIKSGEKSTMALNGFLVFDLKVTEFRYPFELRNSIETNILEGLSSDKEEKVNLGPIGLTIRSVKSYWGEVNEDYTEIVTLATIRNDNLIPITLPKFYCLVKMNEVTLAEGSSKIAAIIEPRSEATVTLITKLDNKMLNE